MKLCVPAKLWQAAMIVAPTDDVRFYLNGVHLDGNRIESTNGHCAYQAFTFKDSTYEVNGVKFDTTYPNVIIKPTSSEPTKSIKNKTVWLWIEGDDQPNEDVLISYIDKNFQCIHIQKAMVIDGKYPDFHKAFAKEFKPNKRDQFNVGFNPEYLALPAKILGKDSSDFKSTVVLQANNHCSAAKIQIKRAGLADSEFLWIMPVRI